MCDDNQELVALITHGWSTYFAMLREEYKALAIELRKESLIGLQRFSENLKWLSTLILGKKEFRKEFRVRHSRLG